MSTTPVRSAEQVRVQKSAIMGEDLPARPHRWRYRHGDRMVQADAQSRDQVFHTGRVLVRKVNWW